MAALNLREIRFSTQVVIILLVSSCAVEAISLLNASPANTSAAPQQISQAAGVVAVGLALSAVYALFKELDLAEYLTLAASMFMVVAGVAALIKAQYASQLGLGLAVSSATSVAFGILAALITFRAESQEPSSTDESNVTPVSLAAKADSSEGFAIETRDVTKKYRLGPNVVPAINGLDMKVRRGEFIAIMGPSGSGKSTLLNLLGALDKPSSGRILIDGVDISGLDENALAKLRNEKIGFVFQAYNLIARSSVMRNMELPTLVRGYGRNERQRRVHDLLGIVGLGDKVLRRPKTLSGGEQQRVAIARALINDPEIVLADEPTGNVDSRTGQVIIDFLRRLNSERGTTVVVVTHDPEVARRMDRVIHIRDGRIFKEDKVRGVSA
jgi:putative ABC transport system ATP-binding protein